jgi:hypothetical protein
MEEGRLHGFEENKIAFPPTFKWSKTNAGDLDLKKKR